MDQIGGTIKTLLKDKFCGFIRTADGEDFFFHKSGLQQTTLPYEQLTEGQRVVFTPVAPEQASRGPRATEVRII